jgi:hypothetical protein
MVFRHNNIGGIPDLLIEYVFLRLRVFLERKYMPFYKKTVVLTNL